MTKLCKRILIVALVTGAVLACAALAAVLLIDGDRYRERLETEVSQALNLEVRFKGPIGVRFTPGLRIRFTDVSVSRRGEPIATVGDVLLGMELMPLFRRELRVRTVALLEPTLSVARDRAGGFNFGLPEALGARLRALGLEEVSFVRGTLRFDDEQSGEKIEARDCSLDLRDLQVAASEQEEALRSISFLADLACAEVQSGKLIASGFRAEGKASDGRVMFDPVALQLFGVSGGGNLQVDFTGESPALQLVFALAQFPLQAFLKQVADDSIAEGRLDFSAELTMQGGSAREMVRNLNGQFSMRGEDLVLNGIDLDESIARFEASQSFNLVDVGAVFLAGPIGLVATQGYRFGSLAMSSGGRSEVRELVSDWRVAQGIAQAQDVALATSGNRLAARGRLNFVEARFDGLTVAVVDAKGCATVEQELRGNFASPEASTPNIFALLTGPARGLIQRGVDLIAERDCEVFYAGVVVSPRQE